MRFSYLFILLLTLPAFAEEPSEDKGGKVSEYMLDNGMKVIVKEDHRAPIAVSQVWYKVGSSYEPDGITGISHVLEHMMFKGTKDLAPGEFSRINDDPPFPNIRVLFVLFPTFSFIAKLINS